MNLIFLFSIIFIVVSQNISKYSQVGNWPQGQFVGHSSFYGPSWSNGFTTGVYDAVQNKVRAFTQYIFRQSSPDSSSTSRNFCYDFYFGHKFQGSSQWHTSLNAKVVEYVNQNGVIHTTQMASNVQYDTYYFSPFSANGNVAVYVIKASSSNDLNGLSLYANLNMHMGGLLHNDNEAASWDTTLLQWTESRLADGSVPFNNYMVYQPVGTVTNRDASPSSDSNNPFNKLVNGQDLTPISTGAYEIYPNTDVICGLESQCTTSTNEFWFGVVVAQSTVSKADAASLVSSYIAGRSPSQLLEDEIANWESWRNSSSYTSEGMPNGIGPEETKTWRMSTAVMRMAQARNPGDGYGQILAAMSSLNEDGSNPFTKSWNWNIAWPRDASFAIEGLILSGHWNEASKGLDFLLRNGITPGKINGRVDLRPYLQDASATHQWPGNNIVSLCRYFGNGVEESDGSPGDYNIELDDIGEVLWIYSVYKLQTKRTDLDKYINAVHTGLAEFIINLLQPDNLLVADSSIWERHWNPWTAGLCGNAGTDSNYNNMRRRHVFSNIYAALGLRTFGKVIGNNTLITKSQEIVKALNQKAVSDGILVGSLDELPCGPKYFMDASIVKAIDFQMVDENIGATTLQAFNNHLAVRTITGSGMSPGYFRNDDGNLSNPDDYDYREWVSVDLSIVKALARPHVNLRSQAKVLLDWVTSQSSYNYYILPELLSWQKQDFTGSVPMTGFGPGMYITAVKQYYSPSPPDY